MVSVFGWLEKRLHVHSMAFMIIVPAVLLLMMVIFPLTTSLGQGVNENVITGFVGVYVVGSHQYYARFYYQGGSEEEIPIRSLNAKSFVRRSSSSMWFTVMDNPIALSAAYQQNSRQLQRVLGTYYNAPGIAAPFPRSPVGYAGHFLQVMAVQKINPATYGGPDIPPGSVPYRKLENGVLHVDTLQDGNTIAQCQPGQIPPQLMALNPALKAKSS